MCLYIYIYMFICCVLAPCNVCTCTDCISLVISRLAPKSTSRIPMATPRCTSRANEETPPSLSCCWTRERIRGRGILAGMVMFSKWRMEGTKDTISPNQIRCVFAAQPTVWKSSMPAMDCFPVSYWNMTGYVPNQMGSKEATKSFPATWYFYFPNGPMGNPPFDGESIGILFQVALSSPLKQFQGMIWERGRMFISRVSWIFWVIWCAMLCASC